VGATGINQPKPTAFLNKSQMFKENFAGIPERKRPDGRRWENNIEMCLQDVGWFRMTSGGQLRIR
jgi:hypothetical protein